MFLVSRIGGAVKSPKNAISRTTVGTPEIFVEGSVIFRRGFQICAQNDSISSSSRDMDVKDLDIFLRFVRNIVFYHVLK